MNPPKYLLMILYNLKHSQILEENLFFFFNFLGVFLFSVAEILFFVLSLYLLSCSLLELLSLCGLSWLRKWQMSSECGQVELRETPNQTNQTLI